MVDTRHDAHARPPDNLRGLFKQWQKATALCFSSVNPDVIDTGLLSHDDRVSRREVSEEALQRINDVFAQNVSHHDEALRDHSVQCFEVRALPGLLLYPSLLPLDVQLQLLDRLLHRDLSNCNHKTNLHLHYTMPSDTSVNTFELNSDHASLFALDPNLELPPKDPAVHKPIMIKQALQRKLRWVTLGGQYDWTNKIYPDEKPPPFPADVADLLQGLFPDVDPQAAILNFYSPGDTLSLHRDVSEECDRGLISISIGCDALFLVANTDGSQKATIRLRSGDAILMLGEARFAWHAVPKVLAGTCPRTLQDWPATRSDSSYRQWRGWLANKRINLNVRQMRKEPYNYAEKLD